MKGSDDGARPQRVRIPSFPSPPGSRIAQVSLKPENLILPAGARAHVVNLSKGTQWNSKVGKVRHPLIRRRFPSLTLHHLTLHQAYPSPASPSTSLTLHQPHQPSRQQPQRQLHHTGLRSTAFGSPTTGPTALSTLRPRQQRCRPAAAGARVRQIGRPLHCADE